MNNLSSIAEKCLLIQVLRGKPAGDLCLYAHAKYPLMGEYLYCLADEESDFVATARGDDGLAYGWFQIHIDKHPISKQCAEDLFCSMRYVVKKVENGESYLWTGDRKCQYLLKGRVKT